MKTAVVILAGALVLSGVACGGGDNDVEDLVAIARIDLSRAELSVADVSDPVVPEEYPDVVARVNGEEITGRSLAVRQVMLELSRRSQAEWMEMFPGEIPRLVLEEIEATDPLEALIEDTLLKQIAAREGLMPSRQEVMQFAREQQELFERRLEEEAGLAEIEAWAHIHDLDGVAWSENEAVIEQYRVSQALARARREFCDPFATPFDGLTLRTDYDCASFLAAERGRADLEYFVRWID